MTGGWKSQLARVRRWYKRIIESKNSIDKLDYMYAFFENAFHLRDWLRDNDIVSEKDMEELFKENEEMRLCRDIANSHKHYSINSPSQPEPPSEIREYSPGTGNWQEDITLSVVSNGKIIDEIQLVKRVMEIWECFISEKVK